MTANNTTDSETPADDGVDERSEAPVDERNEEPVDERSGASGGECNEASGAELANEQDNSLTVPTDLDEQVQRVDDAFVEIFGDKQRTADINIYGNGGVQVEVFSTIEQIETEHAKLGVVREWVTTNVVGQTLAGRSFELPESVTDFDIEVADGLSGEELLERVGERFYKAEAGDSPPAMRVGSQ